MVLHGPFERGGGLVLHNHPIDVDFPGPRVLWINDDGQQLVMEKLDVFLDTLDKAEPGGQGWVPVVKPEFEVRA